MKKEPIDGGIVSSIVTFLKATLGQLVNDCGSEKAGRGERHFMKVVRQGHRSRGPHTKFVARPPQVVYAAPSFLMRLPAQ